MNQNLAWETNKSPARGNDVLIINGSIPKQGRTSLRMQRIKNSHGFLKAFSV